VLLSSALMLGGIYLGPALRAAHGKGTRGEWVAQHYQCQRSSCAWLGEFVLPNGTVTMPRATYEGSLASVYPGRVVPALDSGAGDEVYPVNGTRQWIKDAILLGVGAIGFILLIGRWLYVLLICRRFWLRARQILTRLIPGGIARVLGRRLYPFGIKLFGRTR
jgi:hypothetical protein